MRLRHAVISAHQMGTVFADGVKLALKGLVLHAANRAFADEQLFKCRHGGSSGLAHIGQVGVGW